MFQNKKLNVLLLKNTLAVCFPVLLAVTVLLVWVGRGSLTSAFGIRTADTVGDVSEIYNSGGRFVEFVCPVLRPIGYDSYVNGKKTGSYYYAWMDGQFVIALIDSDQSVLENYLLRGRVLERSMAFDYIWSQCADSMGLEPEQLDAITYEYIISAAYDDMIFRRAVRAAAAAAWLLIALTVLETTVCFLAPWLHPELRHIKGLQNKRLFAGDVNRQLHDALLYASQGCYITKKYLILSSMFQTDILPVGEINVVSRHRNVKRYIPWRPGRASYRLILSDAAGAVCEHEFRDETVLDRIDIWLKENGRA